MLDSAPVRFARNWPILTVCLILFTWLLLLAVKNETLGVIGHDNDDVMRLVQIQDWQAGQSWFDLHQYRLGTEPTLMHWSRLVDLPIAAISALLAPFVEKPNLWAITIWPLLTSFLVVGGSMIGARHLGGERALWFAAAIAGSLVVSYSRFKAGSIDHHNLQFGLLAITIGLMFDQTMRFKSFALAGVALALSLAIGVEVYGFVAVFCAYIAVNWGINGREFRTPALGFSIGFGAAALAIFFITVGPKNYLAVYCDSFSFITVLATSIGAFGLAAIVTTLSNSSFSVRMAALASLSLICGGVLLFVAPQCLENPLSHLPQEVNELWLNHIKEAQSIWQDKSNIWEYTLIFLGSPLLAFSICLWRIKHNDFRSAHFLLLMLLTVSIALSIYQIRYAPFSWTIMLIPLSIWAANVHREGKRKNTGSIGYIFAIAVSIPLVWAFPANIAKTYLSNEDNTANSPVDIRLQEKDSSCSQERLVDMLNPHPNGLILAPSDLAPSILLNTKHSVLAGNYHRNLSGIKNSIDIKLSDTVAAFNLLKKAKIDYVLACPGEGLISTFSEKAPDGFWAMVHKNEFPDFLQEIDQNDKQATLYKVIYK